MNSIKRQSYGDEENIVVKPSIELIADEYEHSKETTNNIGVHTFSSKFEKHEDNVNQFIQTLNKNGYQVKPENAHCLENDNLDEIFKGISDSAYELGGLILFFSGFCQKEGMLDVFDGEQMVSKAIQDIWSKFTSYTCLGLKNKPKIFIFDLTSPSTIETDSRRRFLSTTYDMSYETPAEADILIIYNKTESIYEQDFTDQLCANIRDYGKSEDIISLVTCVNSFGYETRPMIISTLTRKFYFTFSEFRGHHLSIDDVTSELMKQMEEVNERLSHVNIKKKKHNFSFTIGRKSSVRKAAIKEDETKKKTEVFNRNTTIRNSNTRSSTASIPRSRIASQSESDSGKPRWK